MFDEAASVLDKEFEQEIINEIKLISKNKTMIMIAHRLNTLQSCDYIYKFEGGVFECLELINDL